jgi:hypothetical protein
MDASPRDSRACQPWDKFAVKWEPFRQAPKSIFSSRIGTNDLGEVHRTSRFATLLLVLVPIPPTLWNLTSSP